jgi:hypothetical protein
MKTLMLTLLLIASNAFAAKVEITEIGYNDVPSAHYITADYGINTELNRAWAEITLELPGESNFSYLRAQVPGLSIVGDAVVLDVEGQQVECAKIRPRGIFRTLGAKATKNCKFTVTMKKTQVDDGFEISTKKSYVLSLETL